MDREMETTDEDCSVATEANGGEFSAVFVAEHLH